MACVKCGHWNVIGPNYVNNDGLNRECLKYVCVGCGYSYTTPCRDAEQERDQTKTD